MDDASGIDLSLLEGVDEDLLARLHEAGIHNREDLAAALGAGASRRELAETLGVPLRRLDAVHHLNFLAPEEQAGRLFDLERMVEDRFRFLSEETRRLWRGGFGLALAGLLLLGLGMAALIWHGASPRGDAAVDSLAVLRDRVARLQEQMQELRPLAEKTAEDRLLAALSGLGPAPGWKGPLSWSEADHRRLRNLLGEADAIRPQQALSLGLARLAAVENAPLDSLGPLERARAAAALAEEFPPLDHVGTMWDAAAVLVRERLRSRSLGLSLPDEGSPAVWAAEPWPWTTAGFLTAEELLLRLESMPLREKFLPVWSQSLVGLRRDADLGRDALAARPEAAARDYWIRRGELELAVTAAILGKANLLPYHARSPRAFLRQRRAFLERAEASAPEEARGRLAWLRLEYDEALRLVSWLSARREAGAPADGKRWVRALAMLETERDREGLSADSTLAASARAALAASGFPGVADPWGHPRTRWEAGLSPLLMATRAEALRRLGAGPPAP